MTRNLTVREAELSAALNESWGMGEGLSTIIPQGEGENVTINVITYAGHHQPTTERPWSVISTSNKDKEAIVSKQSDIGYSLKYTLEKTAAATDTLAQQDEQHTRIVLIFFKDACEPVPIEEAEETEEEKPEETETVPTGTEHENPLMGESLLHVGPDTHGAPVKVDGQPA